MLERQQVGDQYFKVYMIEVNIGNEEKVMKRKMIGE